KMKDLLNMISGKERESKLLPYWGLESQKQSKHPTGGLRGQSICITGLSGTNFSQLNTLMKHTGIKLEDAPVSRVPEMTIETDKNISTPLIVHTSSMSYYLKPLRKETEDVQTWIHKHLLLPTSEQHIRCTFHYNEAIHIPEWLCYLIIQHFMKPLFK